MKQKYVLTAVAVVAVGAVALGTVPMWEGTNSVKQEETRTSIIEDPVNTETEVTGTPTPLPTTAPVTGISQVFKVVEHVFHGFHGLTEGAKGPADGAEGGF